MHDPEAIEPPYRALVAAIEQLARVQREFGVQLARDLNLPRAALTVVRLLQTRGALPITDIASHLRVDLSVASRHVTALVGAGLVERAVPHTPCLDRRVRTVQLTPAGLQVAATSAREIDARAAATFADWTAEELLTTAAQIQRISADVAAGHHPDQAAQAHPDALPA